MADSTSPPMSFESTHHPRTIMPLRRRPQTERVVIRLLRGKAHTEAQMLRSERSAPALLECFGVLRRSAQAHGMAINPADTIYVGNDEMLLITWLARAQRAARDRYAYPVAPDFAQSIFRCADLLKRTGLSLPAMTRLAGRMRQP